MPDDDPLKTSLTLLGRLRRDPKDQAAWSEFVARYGPRILQWCRGWGLQESDAQDVTQDVLLKLNGLMARFRRPTAGRIDDLDLRASSADRVPSVSHRFRRRIRPGAEEVGQGPEPDIGVAPACGQDRVVVEGDV